MLKVTKAFRASENGVDVVDYAPGDYEQLPPVALAHAKIIKALDYVGGAKKPAINKASAPPKNKA